MVGAVMVSGLALLLGTAFLLVLHNLGVVVKSEKCWGGPRSDHLAQDEAFRTAVGEVMGCGDRIDVARFLRVLFLGIVFFQMFAFRRLFMLY